MDEFKTTEQQKNEILTVLREFEQLDLIDVLIDLTDTSPIVTSMLHEQLKLNPKS